MKHAFLAKFSKIRATESSILTMHVSMDNTERAKKEFKENCLLVVILLCLAIIAAISLYFAVDYVIQSELEKIREHEKKHTTAEVITACLFEENNYKTFGNMFNLNGILDLSKRFIFEQHSRTMDTLYFIKEKLKACYDAKCVREHWAADKENIRTALSHVGKSIQQDAEMVRFINDRPYMFLV